MDATVALIGTKDILRDPKASWTEQSTDHPYYPLNAPIPNHVPNTRSVTSLLTTFTTICIILLTTTTLISRYYRSSITYSEVLTTLWFTLSGTIHILFEGYYITHFTTLPSLNTYPAQLWKEYALSDSRYLTRDPQVLILETITVLVWGPACLLTAYFVVIGDQRRWLIQIIVCTGHLFSATVYYATALVSELLLDMSYSRPETVYYWGYFVAANSVWVIVPGCLLYSAFKRCAAALRVSAKSMQPKSLKRG